MQNQKKTKKRGRMIMWDGRLAITALAVGGTIGFWNLFSGPMVKEQAVAAQPLDPAPQVQSQVVEVRLPPMPTLIPQPAEQGLPASPSVASQPAVTVPESNFQPGARFFLGGASPQALPRIITTTRSSR